MLSKEIYTKEYIKELRGRTGDDPITTFHYFMLERNLLYTGVTRAKDYLLLCATKKAIYMGIHNVNIKQRISRLSEKI
jgi:ATP-dependent exoDNAse (exonuclease V), alpha subunit - helicase superfamily I member